MGLCCCCKDEKKKSLPSIVRDRGCTDILFLALFLVSWAGLVIIMQMAIQAGANPEKVLRGTDMYGNVCGVSNATIDQKFAAWPLPSEYSMVICVSDCNYTNQCDSDRMAWKYPSIPYMDAYCLPELNSTMELAVDISGEGATWDSAKEVFARAVADLQTTQLYMLISPVAAIVVAFIFMIFLKCFAGILTLICLMLIESCLLGLGAMLYLYPVNGIAEGTITEEEGLYITYISYGVLGLAAIFIVVCLFLRKQILIAIAVVKEAAQAIGDMKLIIFFPLLPALCVIAYAALWVVGGLFVASVTEATEGAPISDEIKVYGFGFHECPQLLADYIVEQLKTGEPIDALAIPNAHTLATNSTVYERQEVWQYYGAYYFFHLLWMIQFFYYFGYLTFAGATADWYFTPRDTNGHKCRGSGEGQLTNWPICAAVGRCLRYHLGTICVTALIIAIVQFIRYTIMYIEQQTKGEPPNKMQKALFAAIQCYLKCLECCLDKINKNALIWTAIWGDGFLTAACAAFQLLWRNLGRVAAINIVSSVLLVLAKLAVATLNACAFTGIFIYYPAVADLISSPIAPVCVIWIVSYGVAACFMAVFQAIIDTVFLCFLVDSEANDAGKMMASDSLQKLVGKYESESKEMAEGIKKRNAKRPAAPNGSGGSSNTVVVKPKDAE